MTAKNQNSLILITEEKLPTYGGIQKMVIEIYQLLKRYPYKTQLIYIQQKKKTINEPKLDKMCYGISPQFIPEWIAPIFFYLKLTKKKRAIWDIHFNLRQVIISVIGKWFKQTKRVALFIYGRELILYRKHPPIIRQIIYGWNKYILLPCVDHFFAISSFSSELLQKEYHISPHKISLCRGGIHPPNISPKTIQTKTISINGRTIQWLTISRQVSRKGIQYAIEALAIVKKQTSINIHYTIVGNGYMRPKLEKLVSKYQLCDIVTFLDFVTEDQKQNLYQKADLFLLPAITEKANVEGLGIVYLEAATHYLPSVGFRSGGTPDAVIHNNTGFLVEERNIVSLANALIKLSTNHRLRQKMGKNAFHFACTHRSWEKTVDTIVQKLQLLSKKP